MSRYFLLFLLNLPFILAALLSVVTQYKVGNATKRRLVAQIILWLTVMIGLSLAKPIYEWLFNNQLTQTEPLSLFDVVEITGIVIVFYIANRTRIKTLSLERRLQDLHQELSIQVSESRNKSK